MFSDFANPGVFANIFFLLNFHFLVVLINTAQRYKFSRLKHSAAIVLEPGRLLSAFQHKSGLKLSRHNHA